MDPTAYQTVTLNGGADLQGFRQALRVLIWSFITPEQVTWKTHAEADSFGDQAPAPYGEAGKPIILPRSVGDLIGQVVCHSDPRKYERLYELIWRMKGPHEPDAYAFARPADELVRTLERMKEDVAEDVRRMRERVRFQEMHDRVAGNRFIAWFKPEHFIIEAVAPMFIDRFGSIDWTILTPKGCLWWDRKELAIGPPASRPDILEAEAAHVRWRPHRASVFNPARTEMADTRWRQQTRRWTEAPEADVALAQTAASRVDRGKDHEADMPARPRLIEPNRDVVPKSLEELNSIIKSSEPFVEGSGKAVLGEGPAHANIVLVGEQPGDQEDIQGRPFVGPAGQLLDRALEEAGIDRKKIYVTNAVKHFKFAQRGKRRIHQSPTAGEIKRYRWWLERELNFVKPEIVVALGASAAHALEGRALTISGNRGPHKFDDKQGYITVHPSYLLRLPGDEERASAYKDFVRDLKRVRELAG